MAVIDLKDATVYVRDGASLDIVGAVNNGAGYAKNATSMTVDGFSAAIANGVSFRVGTNPNFYTITGTTGGATPTTLTFTPGLSGAVADDAVITLHGNVLEIKIGEGNLTYSEKRAVTYVKNRGILDTVKLGDETPMEVSLDFTWEFLRAGSGDPPSVEEALKQIGAASTWKSTSTDTCEPYAVDILINYIPPCGSDSELIVLEDFRWESLDHDLKQGQVAVKGNCNVTVAKVSHIG